MKLKENKFKSTVMGAELEQGFEIDGDSPVIFEILRDKMYTDKIAAVCREVASNSRDANREAGNGDNPITIEIVKPNAFLSVSDMSIMFYDEGPGITPDRMSNIYLKYAASTKRGTNEQTGGFGLGAKTPFAYSDTFTVITVCDVDGKRMKYEYSAMIDTTQKGKMVLFDSEECDEPCGTRVIVPIAQEDRPRFERECYKATSFWKVQPEFINFGTDKPKFDTRPIEGLESEILTGDLYAIDANNQGAVAAIDGIPYPIQLNQLDLDYSIDSTSLLLHVPVGSLTISANREQVQYDDDTKEYLRTRLNVAIARMTDEIQKLLDEAVTKAPSLLEAQLVVNALSEDYLPESNPYYALSKMRQSLSRITNKRGFKSEWNGKKLNKKNGMRPAHWSFVKVDWSPYADKWEYVKQSEIRFDQYNYVTSPNGEIEKNAKLYILDTRKTGRRNISAWDGNHDNKSLVLLVPSIINLDEDKYKNDAQYAKIWDRQAEQLHEMMEYFPIEGFYSELALRESDGSVKKVTDKIPYHKREKIDVRIKEWNSTSSRFDLESATIKYDKKVKELDLQPGIQYLVRYVNKLTEYRLYGTTGAWSPRGGASRDQDNFQLIEESYSESQWKATQIIVVADRQAKYFENHPQVTAVQDELDRIVKEKTAAAMTLKEDYIRFQVAESLTLTERDSINQILIKEEPSLKNYLSKLTKKDVEAFTIVMDQPKNRELRDEVYAEIENRKRQSQAITTKLKKHYGPVFIMTNNLYGSQFEKCEGQLIKMLKGMIADRKNTVAALRPYRQGRACVSTKSRRVRVAQ